VRRLLALIPLGLLLAACGGSGGGEGSAAEGAVMQTIRISEKEYSLNPSTVTLPKPGTYEFDVTNDGSITHAFNVEESGGGDEAEAGDIDPGSHKTVKFTFSAGGSYEMYCPIDGHKAQGMAGTIMVGGAAGGGTTTSPEDETTTNSGPGY
jgi:PQQ system protein